MKLSLFAAALPGLAIPAAAEVYFKEQFNDDVSLVGRWGAGGARGPAAQRDPARHVERASRAPAGPGCRPGRDRARAGGGGTAGPASSSFSKRDDGTHAAM